ncbi:MAG: FHA domain-containing protein [Planctomycetia bacterium]
MPSSWGPNGFACTFITQTDDGTWWIQAMPSRNGVWIQVRAVKLSDSSRFQCGEQRFVFVRG